MKKLSRFTWLLILASVRCGNAQTAENSQIPAGPLIVTAMPDMSAWRVDYSYVTETTADSAKAKLDSYRQTAEKDPALAKLLSNSQSVLAMMALRPKRLTVNKTGGIRHEQIELELGYKDEIWSFGSFVVERRPYSAQLVAGSTDLKMNDFPEFNWISRDSFTGVKNLGPVSCLTFQQSVDPTAILTPKIYAMVRPGVAAPDQRVPAAAYVDLKTRYPVAFVFNKDPRHYTILPPPSGMLVVPTEFLEAADAAKARLDAATKPLGKP